MNAFALCGRDEHVWLELQDDGTWRCQDEIDCARYRGRRAMRRQQLPLELNRKEDEITRRCAIGVTQVDRAVRRHHAQREGLIPWPTFDPPEGAVAA